MYFAEMQNHVVRRVDSRTRLISTVAGIGTPSFDGYDGPATKALARQRGTGPDGDAQKCRLTSILPTANRTGFAR